MAGDTENFFENAIDNFYSILAFFSSLLQSPLLLLIRLVWGIEFMIAGYGKLTHADKAAEFFTSLGIPWPLFNVYLASGTEFFGGFLLTIGLASRLTALPLIFTMIVALVTSERPALHQLIHFQDIDPFLSTAPFAFLFAAVIILAFGSGMFSVDYLIRRWRGDL